MNTILPSYVYLLLISIIGVSCSDKSETNTETATPLIEITTNLVALSDEQVANLNVKSGLVEKRNLGKVIKVNGVLDVPPQNLVTISAPLGGFIKNTELLQGMKVRKGQVLAIMEHPDYIQLQQDYLETKSQLEFLELEYKRQQELAAENVNAAKALQLSKSNFLSTKAKFQGLIARLKMINISPTSLEGGEIKSTVSILAPINGFVTQVYVNLGMYVNPTDVMFKIVDSEHLHAEAQVFEKDVSKLKVGQHVRLTLTNESTVRLATVYLIGKEISEERTVRIHCHLEKEDPNLIPGMYFSAIIEMGDHPVTSVPEDAVVNFEGNDFLFIVKGKNTYELISVKAGVTDSGFTEIFLPENFNLTTPIVTQGTYALISQLKNLEE